jgi:mannosyltransferase
MRALTAGATVLPGGGDSLPLSLPHWPRRYLRLLAGLLLLAAGLRLAGLGRQALWLDEAMSLDFARLEATKCLLAEVNNPPLDRLLLHGWLQIVGDASDAWLRLLPATLGILGCLAFAWLAAQLLPPTSALLAIALFCLSPHHVYFSQEIRAYALLSLLATLAVGLHLRGLRPDARRWHGLAFAATLTLGLHAHYQFLWIFALVGGHRVLGGWRLGPRGLLSRLWPVLLAALLFLPWIAVSLAHAGPQYRSYTTDLFRKLTTLPWVLLLGEMTIIVLTPTSDMAAVMRAELPFVAGFGLAFCTLAVPGVLGLWRERGAGRLVLAWLTLPIVGMALVFLWLPLLNARYLMFLLPALCLLLAFGARRLRGAWPARVTAAALLLLQLYALGLYHLSPARGREDWRGVARWVDARAADGDVIVMDSKLVQLPFDRYARNRARRFPVTSAPQSRASAVEQAVQSTGQVFLVEAHTRDRAGLTRQALTARLCLVESAVFERGYRIEAARFGPCRLR